MSSAFIFIAAAAFLLLVFLAWRISRGSARDHDSSGGSGDAGSPSAYSASHDCSCGDSGSCDGGGDGGGGGD